MYIVKVPRNIRNLIIEGRLKGKTYREIGEECGGVSRQRIEQLVKALSITVTKPKKVKFKPKSLPRFRWKDKPRKHYWLWRIIQTGRAHLSKEERLALYNSLYLTMPTICPVLSMELNYNNTIQHKDNSPSLDRIDPTKDYIIGNVRVISWRANRIKNDGTAEEHLAIAKYMSS